MAFIVTIWQHSAYASSSYLCSQSLLLRSPKSHSSLSPVNYVMSELSHNSSDQDIFPVFLTKFYSHKLRDAMPARYELGPRCLSQAGVLPKRPSRLFSFLAQASLQLSHTVLKEIQISPKLIQHKKIVGLDVETLRFSENFTTARRSSERVVSLTEVDDQCDKLLTVVGENKLIILATIDALGVHQLHLCIQYVVRCARGSASRGSICDSACLFVLPIFVCAQKLHFLSDVCCKFHYTYASVYVSLGDLGFVCIYEG